MPNGWPTSSGLGGGSVTTSFEAAAGLTMIGAEAVKGRPTTAKKVNGNVNSDILS